MKRILATQSSMTDFDVYNECETLQRTNRKVFQEDRQVSGKIAGGEDISESWFWLAEDQTGYDDEQLHHIVHHSDECGAAEQTLI